MNVKPIIFERKKLHLPNVPGQLRATGGTFSKIFDISEKQA